MAFDIVTLKQNRSKAYEKLEAILNAVPSENQQRDFDAASAEVETLDRDIANADKLQKLRLTHKSQPRMVHRMLGKTPLLQRRMYLACN